MSVDARWKAPKNHNIDPDVLLEVIRILCGAEVIYGLQSGLNFETAKLVGRKAKAISITDCLGLYSVSVPTDLSPMQQAINYHSINLYINMRADSDGLSVSGYAGVFHIALMKRLMDFFGGYLIPSDVTDKIVRRKRATVFSTDCSDGQKFAALQIAQRDLKPVGQKDWDYANTICPYTTGS